MTFYPKRAAGLSRLTEFKLQAGRDYARLRNSDLGQGNHEHVSMLSPYIRHRLITEQEVVDEVLQSHSFAQSEKFIQEVFWRTYFKGWLEHRPQVWTRYQSELETQLCVLEKDKALRANYDRAVTGETGIECFDYWAQELVETGYLHNHARMWFASIWIYTLQLPWELGADFFLRHLLDGDSASNTLSWRWVAGLHTKGKTYLARADNIERFTNGRFNPQGQLALNAQPLTEPEDLFPDAKLPQSDYLPDEDFIFLVHEDDCHAEGILPTGRAPYLVVGALATSLRSPLNVEAKVSSFAKSAVSDAMQHLGNSKTIIEGDWATQLITDCKLNNIEHVVTAYCPVGPTAQALAQAKSELESADIKLHQIIRPWDRLIWPHANRGFFKVKKKIPRIFEELELSRAQRELL